jgi:uridine kinase
MSARSSRFLVAIVGGSGAGKTWLVDQLQRLLGESVARLSLDDFYRDHSHLPPAERQRVNFDDPQAIDWPEFERVLRDCRCGRASGVPRYDFTSHSRFPARDLWRPKPLVLVDGLWLLHRQTTRRLFDWRIYVDCPERLRFRRRLARDVRERGRTHSSVKWQFQETVAPMHHRFVAPQVAWADIVLSQPLEDTEVNRLAGRLCVRSLRGPHLRQPSCGSQRSDAEFTTTPQAASMAPLPTLAETRRSAL